MKKSNPKSKAAPPGMPSILDRELSERDGDAFGHQSYADALKDLVESPLNTPPFSIGLLGPWGTGKSTIKELYRHGLMSDKIGKVGSRRSDRFHVITFNAWRFGGEQDLKRALLRDAFRQLGGDEAALRRELFEQVNSVTHHKRSFQEWAGEAFGQLVGTAGVFAILLALILLIIVVFVKYTGIDDSISLVSIAVAALVVTGWIGKHVVDLRVRTPAMFLPQTAFSFPSTSAEEYERLLTEQIERFRNGFGKQCQRLIVFVDDLDRLSAPEMVSGLDAIRTFLELPFNNDTNGFGVVFVISCDEERIAEALHRGRGRLGATELPGSVFSRADARRYLDRLFQFRLEIPHFPKQDMRQFAENKLTGASEIVFDLESKGLSAANIIDRLIHVDVQSPRNAIQLLNAFIQSWWIAKQRERGGIGSSAPGALYEGAVTEHPLSLAALCVLRVDFPDFYGCVQTRPEFIHEFCRVVFGTEKAADQAVVTQDMLSKFLVKDADGKLGSDVQIEHRKLRQYLSSIQDLRWPKSLQPLLRLAEDSVTRQFGDRAPAIRDALVSGDVRGVLEGFGRDLDNNVLGQEDITLLEGLTDTLTQETSSRRINASRVLAALVERIPEERRRSLLTPLLRQMVSLKEVRINVGPKAAHKIIKHATRDDRREVAEKFIADFLCDGAIEWRHASGGAINLREGEQFVREVLDLALDVRKINKLPTLADEMLLSWLLSRAIQVGDKRHTLLFVDLESLMAQHSEHLLTDLGSEYSAQVITEFETEPQSILSPQETLYRIVAVFDQLSENGQEDRLIMWEQLTRLISVQPAIAVEEAWKVAEKYRELASDAQARDFLSAFAGRLKKELDDDKSWPLNWKVGANVFNDSFTQWRTEIDSETGAAIEPLITAWAVTEECEEYAIRALNLLRDSVKQAWDTAITNIIQGNWKDTPIKVCAHVGREAAFFEGSHATSLVAQMDTLINQPLPDHAVSERYYQFARSIPIKTWGELPWSDHLRRLFIRLRDMHADTNFLTRIYPSAMALFSASSKGQTAKLLLPLFENAAGAPEAFIALHRLMAGHWPIVDEHCGNYNPDNIVERSCKFIENNSGNQGIGDVLCSMISLSENGIASASTEKQIASVIPKVWIVSPDSIFDKSPYVGKILEPNHVATILAGNYHADLTIDQLRALLKSVVSANNSEANYKVLKGVLSSQPKSLFGQPDGAVVTWLDCIDDHLVAIVGMVISDDTLNDSQKRRVMIRFSDFFKRDLAIVKSILQSNEDVETRSVVIEQIKKIDEQSLSTELKVNLASRLIESLPSLSGDQFNIISRSISKLGGKSALEKSSSIEELDANQIKILQKIFPESRILKNLKV
ncbi:hypothetical protein J4E05_10745 [Thalassospira sp. NFXS8]|uniref:KAP family P-loop NTPase fold protein n=1 Tax=Thalassospira sp. NFXS8 TaxID=2819093 RepID=UPI0032DFDFDC